MANALLSSTSPSALQMLQVDFAIIRLNGDIYIVDFMQIDRAVKSTSEDISYLKRSAGNIVLKRRLEAISIASDPKKTIAEFLVSPNTREYDAVAFSPLPTPATTLNFWVGSPIIPYPGDCTLVKCFLLEVICDGDMALFRYVMLFLAHMLTRPEDKPGIIIVLLGGQGIGKGSFIAILRAIWRHTTLQVSDIKHVIGQFNAALERHYAICMDEAFFAGDKNAIDRLKSFVTEPVITIEQKHQPRRSIESFHRFFATSNHMHFAQIDRDDRRFVFLQVSERHKEDHQYWDQLHKALADPAVIAALVHELLSYNIDGFNPRKRPLSKVLIDQKIQSLSGFYRYWFEVLQTGNFLPAEDHELGEPWTDETFAPSHKLMRGWRDYERGQRQFGARQERGISQALERLCPSAKYGRKTTDSRPARGYYLPPLPAARAEFALFLGGEVQWGD